MVSSAYGVNEEAVAMGGLAGLEDNLGRVQDSEDVVESVDLPPTFLGLQLRQTAYQVALSTLSRGVQASLLEFLR